MIHYFYFYQITFWADEKNNESQIEKVNTLAPALEIVLYCISPSHAINTVYLLTGARACVRIYVICAEFFGGVSVISEIQKYITVLWGNWYARVPDTRHSLAGFLLYPRYRYLITIVIGMYRCLSVLSPYPFWFKSIA